MGDWLSGTWCAGNPDSYATFQVLSRALSGGRTHASTGLTGVNRSAKACPREQRETMRVCRNYGRGLGPYTAMVRTHVAPFAQTGLITICQTPFNTIPDEFDGGVANSRGRGDRVRDSVHRRRQMLQPGGGICFPLIRRVSKCRYIVNFRNRADRIFQKASLDAHGLYHHCPATDNRRMAAG